MWVSPRLGVFFLLNGAGGDNDGYSPGCFWALMRHYMPSAGENPRYKKRPLHVAVITMWSEHQVEQPCADQASSPDLPICKRKGLSQCSCVLESSGMLFKVQLLGAGQTYWTRLSRWETQEAGLSQTWSFHPELESLHVAWSYEIFLRSWINICKSFSGCWGPFYVLHTHSIWHSRACGGLFSSWRSSQTECFLSLHMPRPLGTITGANWCPVSPARLSHWSHLGTGASSTFTNGCFPLDSLGGGEAETGGCESGLLIFYCKDILSVEVLPLLTKVTSEGSENLLLMHGH